MESQWFFDLLFFNLIFYFDEKSLWHTFSNDKRNFSGFLLKLFYLEMHWKKNFCKGFSFIREKAKHVALEFPSVECWKWSIFAQKSLAHTYLLRGTFASYILMKIVPIYCRFRNPNGKLQFSLKYFSIHFFVALCLHVSGTIHFKWWPLKMAFTFDIASKK